MYCFYLLNVHVLLLHIHSDRKLSKSSMSYMHCVHKPSSRFPDKLPWHHAYPLAALTYVYCGAFLQSSMGQTPRGTHKLGNRPRSIYTFSPAGNSKCAGCTQIYIYAVAEVLIHTLLIVLSSRVTLHPADSLYLLVVLNCSLNSMQDGHELGPRCIGHHKNGRKSWSIS